MKPIKNIKNYRGWKPKLNLIKELKILMSRDVKLLENSTAQFYVVVED